MPVQMDLSQDMIEEVWKEWELANPGKTYRDMTSDQFADAMMKKMIGSAKIIRPDGGDPH